MIIPNSKIHPKRKAHRGQPPTTHVPDTARSKQKPFSPIWDSRYAKSEKKNRKNHLNWYIWCFVLFHFVLLRSLGRLYWIQILVFTWVLFLDWITGDENQFTMHPLVAPPPPDVPYSEFLKIASFFFNSSFSYKL